MVESPAMSTATDTDVSPPEQTPAPAALPAPADPPSVAGPIEPASRWRALSPAPRRQVSPASLAEEVAPWGTTVPMFSRRFNRRGATGAGNTVGSTVDRQFALVDETDPFARLEGKTAGEFYRQAESMCPALAHGRASVVNRVCHEGWVIEPGSAGGKDADMLRDWTEAWLNRRELQFDDTLPDLFHHMFYGWQPYQKIVDDWFWTRTVTSRRSQRVFKVPSRIIDKDSKLFKYNIDRDLVFIGHGTEREVIPLTDVDTIDGDTARLTWMVPYTGSKDDPYGKGLYRRSGAAAAYLIWKDMWDSWQRGIDRSMGVLMATIEGTALSLSDGEVRTQLLEMADYLNSSNILKPPAGMSVEWMTNIPAYSDGWKDPLNRLEMLISLTITGQGLSVGMGRSAQGSRAAADVEEGRAGRWAKATGLKQAEAINTWLIDPVLEWNWASIPQDIRPKFVFRSTRQIDPEMLRTYVDLARNTSASPPDWDSIADRWQIPVDEDAQWSTPTSLPGESGNDADNGTTSDDLDIDEPGGRDSDEPGAGGAGDDDEDDGDED